MKKLFSLLLSVVMFFSITVGLDFSSYATENGDFEYSILDDGTAEITDYTGSSHELIIPCELDGYTVTSIGEYAFSNCTSLTSVIIPDGVTVIGDAAFRYCESLATITIPDSITSIGYDAFSNCTSLTSITIPDSITSIGYDAFCYCTSLTSVTIPNSVTSIGDWAFAYCKSLISINVDSNNKNYSSQNGVLFNKDKTELIQYPIGNTRTSYIIPNSVTGIGESAFAYCTSLTSINVDSNNEYYSSQEGALFNKDKTELIQYPIGNTRTFYIIPNSVIIIGEDAFRGCTSLTNVTIPDSITSIDECAFEYCTSLTNITIPNSVTSIDSYTFRDCTSLTSITIPNSITSIGYNAFSNTGYYNNESNWKNGVLYINNCLIDTNIDEISPNYNIIDGTRVIADSAFEYCTSLTSITIPNSITSIGNAAFYSCESLTNIAIPNSIASIGKRVFSHCKSIISITIPNSVTSIGNEAFHSCESLTNITIPKSVTSIGEFAFYYCPSLTNINVDSNNKNYLSQDGILFNKDKTELIQYPIGNTRTSYIIPNSVIIIGDSAFSGWTSLTSITIPDSVTSIGGNAFYYCESLTDVYYSGCKADWNKIHIEDYNECLTNATIHYNYTHTHTYNNYLITQLPTCIETGVITYICSKCGETKTETVPATGHNFGNNGKNCSICGVTNPNYVEPEKPTQPSNPQPIAPTQPSNSQPTAPTEKAPKGAKKINGEWVAKKQKNTKISKLAKAKKSFKASWKKVRGVTGYQIQYSTSKKFTKKTTKSVTVKGSKKTSTTVKKLKSKKKYYVRIRTYKNVKLNGKTVKVYSSWSKAKTVTTK